MRRRVGGLASGWRQAVLTRARLGDLGVQARLANFRSLSGGNQKLDFPVPAGDNDWACNALSSFSLCGPLASVLGPQATRDWTPSAIEVADVAAAGELATGVDS
jgi:hypothetical protein